MKRSYPSGSEKRKAKEDKKKRLSIVQSQTRQITSFFKNRGAEPDNADVTVPPDTPNLTGQGQANPDEGDRDRPNWPSTTTSEKSASSEPDSDADDHDGVRVPLDGEQFSTDTSDSTHPTQPELDLDNTRLCVVPPGLLTDIGDWPVPATEEMREYWAKKGIFTVRKSLDQLRKEPKENFASSLSGGRRWRCTVDMFVRKTTNGEIERKWLCYSTTTGRLYCFQCKLFSNRSNALANEGFNKWKKAPDRLAEHEKSHGHSRAILIYAQRAEATGRIDIEMQKQIDEMTVYWVKVLQRCVSVITMLAERNLAFRGDNQTIGSPHNGNYLGLLELIAQYDPFLDQHIKNHANKGKGHTNYLSSVICEELLAIMDRKVLEVMVERVKKAKYFSVTVDSSEDNSHVDQLTVVLRYLEGSEPVERFFTFLESTGHKGIDMANALQSYLEKIVVNIRDCRGQSYDNASNMSGRYQGMQSRILQVNEFAIFVPCFAHSLNLVGQEAASACTEAVLFFDMVQSLFVFFTSSTSLYKKLKDKLVLGDKPNLMPKKLSATRWSCRSDAVGALVNGYEEIVDVLLSISEDKEKKADCRCKAQGLYDQMNRLETGIFAKYWNVLLQRFNSTSKTLQSVKLNLNDAVRVLKSLVDFVQGQRDRFDDFEEAGICLSGTNEYITQNRRARRRNVRLDPLDYGHAEETELTSKEMFRIKAFIPCTDTVIACIEQRLAAYKDVSDRFGFLADFPSMDADSIQAAGTQLAKFYPSDLDEGFGYELIQFQSFLLGFIDKKPEDCNLEQFMYKLLLTNDVEATFPNTATALRIYLTLMISNCSGERSFSKMKLVKNLLRTTMGQDRLACLTRLSLESDILRGLDFTDIIHTFASVKARKVVVVVDQPLPCVRV